MKRTILVGASMFALISGVSAQTGSTSDFEAFQASWKKSHNVTTELTPAQYEQMKMEWMSSTATETASKRSTAEETALKEAQYREAHGLPAGFPVKQNTGDPVADKANYEQAKAAWIANNPELYEQMKTTSTQTQAERQAIRQAEINNQNQ